MFGKILPIVELLKKLREQAGLSQAEVAERMGLSRKSGYKYIYRLEKGLIKNPSLLTILNYLDAIGVRWPTFFTELSKIRDQKTHQKIMSKVELPSDEKLRNKLDRDILLYEIKIQPPQNYYTQIDLDLVKQKVKNRVLKYCQNLNIKDELIPHYLEYAQEILKDTNNQQIIEKYFQSGVSKNYLIYIRSLVKKIVRIEQKKIAQAKPLSLAKRQAMAEKYLQSRIQLVSFEPAISKLLIENNLKDTVWYNFYMNFARECFGRIKKYYHTKPNLLTQHLAKITQKWHQRGLKLEILETIKEALLKLLPLQKTSAQ